MFRFTLLRLMMAMFLTVMAVSLAAAQAKPPESDTARKVRVALALAGGCGTCRTDLDECRAEALKQNKPLVLFVGPSGCEGKAKELPGTDAIYCRVPTYSLDGKSVEGIVILGKDKAHKADTLYILDQLPKSATPADIKAAVKLAHSKAPPAKAAVPLDWDFSRDAADDADGAEIGDSEITTDGGIILSIPVSSNQTPTLFADCPNGRCAVPAAVSQTAGRVASAVRATGADGDCGCSGCAGAGRTRRVLFSRGDGSPMFPRLARLFGRG